MAKFDSTATQILRAAYWSAQESQSCVDTLDLLRAILAESSCKGRALLSEFGIDAASLSHEPGLAQELPDGMLSQEAALALDVAGIFASGQGSIQSHHLVLGLACEQRGAAGKLLRGRGLTPEACERFIDLPEPLRKAKPWSTLRSALTRKAAPAPEWRRQRSASLLRCSVCGLESQVRSAFSPYQPEPTCLGCARQKARDAVLFSLGRRVGLLACALTLVLRSQPIGWLAVNSVLCLICEPVVLFTHEMGHVLASLALRLDLLSVTFGIGDEWLSGHAGKVPWTLRKGKRRGRVAVLTQIQQGWKTSALLHAAGPLANLSVASAIWWRLGAPGPWNLLLSLVSGPSPGLVLLFCNVLQALQALWITGADYPNDGWQLRKLWRERARPQILDKLSQLAARGSVCLDEGSTSRALHYYRLARALAPGNPDLLNGEVACHLALGDFKRARELAFPALQASQTLPSRARALRQLSVCCLHTPNEIAEAEMAARHALAMLPNHPETLCCLGACLVLQGQAQEGNQLIRQGLWLEDDRTVAARAVELLIQIAELHGYVEQRLQLVTELGLLRA